MRPLAKPVDDTVKYCNVDDVNRYLRGFDLSNSNREPTKSTVQSEIEAETDRVEKKLKHIAFRKKKVENYVIDDDVFTSSQKRRKLGYKNFSQPYVDNTSSEAKVNYNLYYSNVTNVSKLVTYTNDEEGRTIIDEANGIDKTDLYRLEEKNGHLKLDLEAFDRNIAREHGNIYKNARIEISYTFGYDYVPDDIARATAQRVAGIIVSTDAYGKTLDGEYEGVSADNMKNELFNEADKVIDDYVRQYT